MPLSIFSVQRVLAWSYNTTLSGFSAPVNMRGTVTAAKLDDSSTRPDLASGTVNCTLSGEVSLFSRVFPGPGFNGTYDLLVGSQLRLDRDPWSWFGAQTPATPARHLLGADQGGNSDQLAATNQHCATDNGRVVCPGFNERSNSRNPGHTHEEQNTHGLSPGRRHLLSDDTNTTTTTQPIQGRLTVVEPSGNYPATAEDTARGDSNAWLDATGSVLIEGIALVPPSLVPAWKHAGPALRREVPIWFWLAVAGGLLLLCMLGCCCIWAVVAACRRHKRQKVRLEGVHHLGLQPVLPGQAMGPWASRVLTPPHHQGPITPGGDRGKNRRPTSPSIWGLPGASVRPQQYPSTQSPDHRSHAPDPRAPVPQQQHAHGDGPGQLQYHQQHPPPHMRSGAAGWPRTKPRSDPWEGASHGW